MDADIEQLRLRVSTLEQESARSKRTTRIALVVGALGVLSPMLSMTGLLNAKFRKVAAREVDVSDAAGKTRVQVIGDDNGGVIDLRGEGETDLSLQTTITGAVVWAKDVGGQASLQVSRDPVLGAALYFSASDPTTLASLTTTTNTGANAGLMLATKNGMSMFDIHDRGPNDFHAQAAVGIGRADGPSAKIGADTYEGQNGVAGLDVTSGGYPNYSANVSVQKDHATYKLGAPNNGGLFIAELADGMSPSLDIQQGDKWFWHAQNQVEKNAVEKPAK
jgi:hypothetical protein